MDRRFSIWSDESGSSENDVREEENATLQFSCVWEKGCHDICYVCNMVLLDEDKVVALECGPTIHEQCWLHTVFKAKKRDCPACAVKWGAGDGSCNVLKSYYWPPHGQTMPMPEEFGPGALAVM